MDDGAKRRILPTEERSPFGEARHHGGHAMTAPLPALSPAHEIASPLRTNLTPGRDIAEAIRTAARSLDALAGLSDMQSAIGERAMKEEASAFVAYLAEIARPLDLMLREILRKAADNVGAFSPIEQDECVRSRIVTDTLHDQWLASFQLAAIGAECEPAFYTRRYARALAADGR
jgi:hypothetical protein